MLVKEIESLREKTEVLEAKLAVFKLQLQMKEELLDLERTRQQQQQQPFQPFPPFLSR